MAYVQFPGRFSYYLLVPQWRHAVLEFDIFIITDFIPQHQSDVNCYSYFCIYDIT
jgi:hypothetical protein